MIMDSAKSGSCIIPFKKVSRLRVKNLRQNDLSFYQGSMLGYSGSRALNTGLQSFEEISVDKT